ncbi:hypothetical protein QT973_07590 [Microcoleus sp. Z1_A1]
MINERAIELSDNNGDRPFGYLEEKGDRTLGKKGDRTFSNFT